MATILLVDDSASIRQLAAFTLRSAGHQVLEADNGKKGLELAKQESVDLILSDINMPKMNGLELTQALRCNDSTRYTPILILTTETDATLKQRGKEAGVTGWLIKPFQPEKLIQTINHVL